MDELRQRFGRLVAANRRRKGWTQQQLADHSGVSLDMINRIERGVSAARFPNITKLALPDRDLEWIGRLLDAALKPRT